MGHIYVTVSPCEMTPQERNAVERDYPGLRFPDGGRLASRVDIEAAFASHPDWRVEIHQGTDWWTAFVRSPSQTAVLRVSEYSGHSAREHPFHFDTGDPELVVDITAAIAERCGAFFVADESGSIAVLVRQDGSRSDIGPVSAGGSRPPRSQST